MEITATAMLVIMTFMVLLLVTSTLLIFTRPLPPYGWPKLKQAVR